jgi:hypothetical protein
MPCAAELCERKKQRAGLLAEEAITGKQSDRSPQHTSRRAQGE